MGPKLVMVARTGTPIPEVPSDRNSTGNAVGVQSSPVSLARCCDLVVRLAGPRQARQVALDVGHHHRNACGGELLGDHLQRLRLTGAGRACDKAVPVDGGQRNAHLRSRIDGAVNDDGAQFERLTLDGVSGGDLLGGGCCRLGRHGSNITVRTPRRWVWWGTRSGVGLLLIAVRDELVWIDCEMTGLDLEVRPAHRNRGAGDRCRPQYPGRRHRRRHPRSRRGAGRDDRGGRPDARPVRAHRGSAGIDRSTCPPPRRWCWTTSAATSSRPRRLPLPATRSPPTAASSPATCRRSTTTCTTG